MPKRWQVLTNFFIQQLVSYGPTQKQTAALATEWKDQNGNRALLVISSVYFSSGTSTNWGYMCTVLEAPENEFSTRKGACYARPGESPI